MRPALALAVAFASLPMLAADTSPRTTAAPPPSTSGAVRALRIEGVINPVTSRYLSRELEAAARERAELVLVELDTPGGLESSMREMVANLLGSAVPVVVYVAPSGARAASAGMFLTLAGHVAAMAPGTNIGAAHPVGLGGSQPDEVMSAKVTNDAAALARAIAEQRGRNASWAEQAVRESVSITAQEAADRDVIDLLAPDRGRLLAGLDGRVVRTTAGEQRLSTAEAPVEERPMTLFERILMVLVDPNIAYVLFMVGVIGLLAELYNPGGLFPGIIGAVSMVLAFVGFGSLPINWAGVMLLVAAVGLFIAELQTSGVGLLAAGAAVCLVLGSLLLFTPFSVPSPAAPAVAVSPWLIALVTGATALFFIGVLRALVRTRRIRVSTGAEALIGREAVSVTELAPRGIVRLDTEEWSAEADEPEPVHAGERVRITEVRGVTLHVRRPEGAHP